MSNLLIPRATVHDWSETIGQHLEQHHTGIQRLLKDQRRLTRFIEENREQLGDNTGGVAVYMTGVIARMFELAGGELRNATWEQVRTAQAKVSAQLPKVLPLDDGFTERFRAADRAQAHILDEAWLALFESTPADAEEELNRKEALKVLLLCWVVTEVLDMNWRPAKGFAGEASYTYVHIEPTKRGDPA